ncbi:MAG: hypothetical protein MUQ30_14590 [Anaerolineae bacterium]|nr:hypothetical protein [Anaerolineae bacterium]
MVMTIRVLPALEWVLMHLTRGELAASFLGQSAVPAPGGVALHSFWYGDAEEVYEGLRFVYHAEATLHEAIGDALEVVEVVRYAEVEEGNSLYVVVRRWG